MITRFLVASLLILGTLFTGGCAFNQYDTAGFNLISVADEKQLGDRFAGEIEKKYTVVQDPEVQAYVDRLGKRLLSGTRKVEFPYTFKVVKDDSINAFAIPGGHTYIHTGLIKRADNESELAAVLAHEINHVVARHGTRQMTQDYGYGLLLQLVLGQNPNLLAKLTADLFGKAGSMAYSRGMETQADILAVETLYKTGYNPNGIITFFRKLEVPGQQKPGQLASFFSTHPMTADRIQSVNDEIAKFPAKAFTAEDNKTFQRIKIKVN
jgi:predicted Zn-dependent protease